MIYAIMVHVNKYMLLHDRFLPSDSLIFGTDIKVS